MSEVTTNDPIGLIAACLPDFGATELDRESGSLRISLPVPLSDGRQPVFVLDVAVTGASVSAREAVPTHLPSYCPDRHINGDGSFCLFWRAVDDIEIDAPEAARAWLETLVRFLQLQFRAARLRRWPDRHGRAHGWAAIHQHRAEVAAARLGEPFVTDIAEGRLTTSRKSGSAEGTAIRVLKDGRRLFSVWERSRRAVNQRRPCLCPAGSGRRPVVLKSCGDHAAAAADLALAMNEMVIAEARFWKSAMGAPCCGTIDGCPLAKAS
ncbi:MAG: E2 domain-associated cysteine-rich protein [Pseudomonadota bacterium]